MLPAETAVLVIDGSHGEGGGQVLRTSLSLAALTGRPIRIENIRAGRRKPGLAAQHLTAVRAAAAICGAKVSGDALGSPTVSFTPAGRAVAGDYRFDVAEARPGGSAGAATLVLQTVLLPLAFARGGSRVVVRGGTHMPGSPPFDYLAAVWLPFLARLGIPAAAELAASGWFPVGEGEIALRVAGGAEPGTLRPVALVDRGRLTCIRGRAIAASLPAHIAQRMADRARPLLMPLGAELRLAAERMRAACPGAGTFLTAEYEHVAVGFSGFGALGKASEAVAEEAALALLRHESRPAALDLHLADQVLLPLAFAAGESRFTVEEVTLHLETNAWVIDRFGLAATAIERRADGAALLTVLPEGGR